ncbi:unnamed protein product [Closterium sp. Naga37s-1]|nr:unnamed protein product [Closterium sp. Naga37s-1]
MKHSLVASTDRNGNSVVGSNPEALRAELAGWLQDRIVQAESQFRSGLSVAPWHSHDKAGSATARGTNRVTDATNATSSATAGSGGGSRRKVEGWREQQQALHRIVDFWRRAVHLYGSYKLCQLRVRVSRLSEEQRRAAWEEQHERGAEILHSLCTEMQGFFLKAGQFLAKPDMSPPAWVRRLAPLHDSAPADPFPLVRRTVEAELARAYVAGSDVASAADVARVRLEDVFAEFEEEPVGSASIAQVHRGRLKDGRRVAIKVQRAGAERLMLMDLANLRLFGAFLQRAELKVDLLGPISELEQQIRYEFDFEHEAAAMERIRHALAQRDGGETAGGRWERHGGMRSSRRTGRHGVGRGGISKANRVERVERVETLGRVEHAGKKARPEDRQGAHVIVQGGAEGGGRSAEMDTRASPVIVPAAIPGLAGQFLAKPDMSPPAWVRCPLLSSLLLYPSLPFPSPHSLSPHQAGQFLAKPDMSPPAWVRRLAPLHDSAPADPFPLVRRTVEAELARAYVAGSDVASAADVARVRLEDVFAEFEEEPVGSASIAQVHRGRLKDGRRVAIKVQRAGAERLMLMDLANLRLFGAFLQRAELKVDLLGPISELEQQIRYEFDFEHEAAAMERIRHALAQRDGGETAGGRWERHGGMRSSRRTGRHGVGRGGISKANRVERVERVETLGRVEHAGKKARPEDRQGAHVIVQGGAEGGGRSAEMDTRASPVIVPAAIPGLVTRGLLVMDFIDGTPILRLPEEMRKRGISPSDALARQTKSRIFSALSTAYGRMLLQHGHFQADPHPGNILVCAGGRVALLDYGQTKQLPEALRLNLARLVVAIADEDMLAVGSCFTAMGIETAKTAGEHPNSFRRMAMIMFDTGSGNGVTSANPFGAESSLKSNAMKAFPADIFFIFPSMTAFPPIPRHSAHPHQILMVDFDFFDAQPSDYHGVKALLRTFLDGKRWDLPAFVDAVTSGTPGGGAAGEGDAAGSGGGGSGSGSGSVATVVKAGDEGSILGLTACLPLICKSKGWTADFVRFLHEGCDNRAQWDELWKVMQRGRVGVVVCERVPNLPFQLVPHLFRSTLQPMLEKGAPVEKFLILTRMYRQTGGKAARKQAKGAGSSASELFFPKPEDELLKKLATSSYSFPVHADVMASRQLKGFQHLRLVMLLSAAQVRNFLEQVNDMVDED